MKNLRKELTRLLLSCKIKKKSILTHGRKFAMRPEEVIKKSESSRSFVCSSCSS